MLELLKKNLLIGAGLASMTQSKIMELGKKLADESKLSEKEGKKFINDLLKQAEDAKSSLEDYVNSAVEKTVGKIKIPCNENFKKLEKEIKDLKKEIEKLEKKL